MTASLPDPRETSSSDTEGVAASVEPSAPAAPAAPRAPRRTTTSADKSPDATDAADSAAAAKPAPKPRAPRAPRATPARTGSGAAARTPAAKKPSARTAAAKKPATPRTPAAKKPSAPRASSTPKTAAAAAAADAAIVSAPGAEDSVTFSAPGADDSAVVSSAGAADPAVALGTDAPDATADSAAVAEDALETSTVADAPDGSTTASAAVIAADEAEATGADASAPEVDVSEAEAAEIRGSHDPSEQVLVSAGGVTSTEAFTDIVIPPRPPLPPRIDAPATSEESLDDAPRASPRIASVTDADASAVNLDSEGADELPSSERSDAAGAVVDPTPADVAVEEPATAPTPDASHVDTTAPVDIEDETEIAGPTAVEVITATPLETPRHDDRTDAVAPVDDGEHDEPGRAQTVSESASVAEAEDPTPPDVRIDDETGDEASDASAQAETPDAAAADGDVADGTAAGLVDGGATSGDLDEVDAADAVAGGVDATEAAADDVDAEIDATAAERDAVDDDATDDDLDAVRGGERETATTAVLAADPAVASESEGAEAGDAAAGAETPALTLRHITKTFGDLRAVDAIDLTVPAGSFYGLVGPNGAGKTTTLSIIAGLLRADAGDVTINGVDAKKRAREAKKLIGVLPDRLRTFDRLTGRQLLSYYGALRGLPGGLVESRTADLARAFDLVDALARPVSDYSAGMTKKVMLAGAMIHSPRLLVLDEPFEAVDPVSSGVILDILRTYVDHGGTVILSSHGMELVERVCSRVAVIVSGQVLAEGTVDEVRGEGTLEERFRELSGGLGDVEGLEWLHTFSA